MKKYNGESKKRFEEYQKQKEREENRPKVPERRTPTAEDRLYDAMIRDSKRTLNDINSRQLEKEEKLSAMRRHPVNITFKMLGIVVLIAVIAVVFGFVRNERLKPNMNVLGNQQAGTVLMTNEEIKINNIPVRGYVINNRRYFEMNNLKKFGFVITKDDDEYYNLSAPADNAYKTPKKVKPAAITSSNAFKGSMIASRTADEIRNDEKGVFIQYMVDDKRHVFIAEDALMHLMNKPEDRVMGGTTKEANRYIYYFFGSESDVERMKSEMNAPAPAVIQTPDAAAVSTEAATEAVSEAPTETPAPASNGKVIVLDPGHGKSTGAMSAEELTAQGYTNNGNGWGEWRHFKSGTWGEECQGGSCPQDYSCWYPAGNGDRVTEPEINLNNATAAKKYLEEMGYTVRMTRESNDVHPSFNYRAAFAFPDGVRETMLQSGGKADPGVAPDAECIVCIHSNAGGARGSCYITPEGGSYDHKYLPENFVAQSNSLGEKINNRIVNETSLGAVGNGQLGGMNYLILFHKAPVPIAYMEIGFFDDSSDLAILNSEYDAIGKAIAEGVDEWYKSNH